MNTVKRIVDLLAPLGFALAVAAVGWSRLGKTLPGGLRPYLVAALALVLLHLVLRWDVVFRRIGRRQLKYGTNAVVLALVVLGTVGFANYFVARHTKRFDLTKDRRFSLSDQSRKVLAGLKDEIKITYFQRQQANLGGEDRLKEYQALSPKLKVEFVDPVRSPARAQAYDVRAPWPVLIVEKGSRRERISNDTEQDITNALIKVTREGKKTVCLAEGEGERSGDDSGETGFSGAKAALTTSLYDVKSVFLLREKKVPSECTVLIVAGPQRDLLPETTAAIRDYVKSSGKALVMVGPELKQSYPNLIALLKEWNIDAGKDFVVDASGVGQLFGLGAGAPLVLDYPYHQITKDFRGLMTVFPSARSMAAASGASGGIAAQDLAKTSDRSWAETDLSSLLKQPTLDPKTDKVGPISLAVAATVPVAQPSPSPSPAPAADPTAEPARPREGRVAAIGTADFAANTFLGFQGNQDFFLNTVAWLAEDADLISIRPKEPENQAMTLSRQVQQNVGWLALVILPGLFVVAGVVTWWKRR